MSCPKGTATVMRGRIGQTLAQPSMRRKRNVMLIRKQRAKLLLAASGNSVCVCVCVWKCVCDSYVLARKEKIRVRIFPDEIAL